MPICNRYEYINISRNVLKRACLLDKCYMPLGLDVRITNVLMCLNLRAFFCIVALHPGVPI